MRFLIPFAALILVLPLQAKFGRVDIEKVPVERITVNLQKQVEKDPKDAAALVNLARAHAMAYSLRSDDLPVEAKKPESIWFGYTPPIVPYRTIVKTDDKDRIAVANKHRDEALKLYAKALELQPDDTKAALGRAWLLSNTDNKDEAVKALRATIEKAWEKEKDLTRLGLGGHTISGEGAGYLIPLLDEKKDAEEIAKWKERSDKLKKLPRPITPIAIPLKDGLAAADIEARSAKIAFDADGTGLQKNWTWINGNAAWLVHDPKTSGRIESGLQLFGNVTFWMFWDTGYGALAALDDNRDGELSGKELAGLALWHDANGNGVSDPGEVKPLADHGIVSISCRFERDETHPDRIVWSKAGVRFKDGNIRPTYDLVLQTAK